MRSLKVISFIIGICLLLSCSKKEIKTYGQSIVNGIKITESTTAPADSSFNVVLKEVCFIENENDEDPEKCFKQASLADFDENGNLYVFDRLSYKVFKYDPKGKLIRIFGGQGQEPGEFVNPGTVNVRKDTLFITDLNGFKILKFSPEGEFISFKQYDELTNFPYSPFKFGENYITFGAVKSSVTDEGKNLVTIETSFYDSNFNFIKNLLKIEYEPPADDAEFDPSEKGLLAAASDTNAYVYENSKTLYKIDVYDKTGNKVREIRKQYTRIKTTEDQLRRITEMWKQYGKNIRQEFRNSIYSLSADKFNRLWVMCPTNQKEEGYNYDVFENDIFVNRIKLDIDEDYMPNFIGDKIVGVNYKENKIKIYEY